MSSHSSSSSSSSSSSLRSGSLTSATTPTPTSYAPGIVFTTSYVNGPPTPMPAPVRSSAPIPIAPIAGGAAAGVALAVILVVGWQCWGRRIKQKEKKKRDEELAAIQVRENTRRNASTLPVSSYTPAYSLRPEDRKVTFASAAPTLTGNTVKAAFKDKEKAAPEVMALPPRSHSPPASATKTRATRTPFVYRTLEPIDTLTPPPLPRRSRLRHSNQTIPAIQHINEPPSVLAHQASTISSESVYSTQSGEERQRRVPSSLIMAALGHSEGRRSWFSSYFPIPTPHPDGEPTRISQVSSMSAYSQPDSPVGFAISGDEGMPPGKGI